MKYVITSIYLSNNPCRRGVAKCRAAERCYIITAFCNIVLVGDSAGCKSLNYNTDFILKYYIITSIIIPHNIVYK